MEIHSLYEQLYTDCIDLPSFQNDAHFVSLEGLFYRENDVHFLLVGRAANSWESLPTASSALFSQKAQAEFEDHTRFSWIEEKDGVQYSRHDKDKPLKERYKVNTPFWNYSHAIWHNITNGKANRSSIWQENIAWTNLYKISPKEGNNPEPQMQKAQLNMCREILRHELESYMPTHILFLTGYDWFEPFHDLFTQVHFFGTNSFKGAKKNNIYVEATARYKDAGVIIACRPEFRAEEPFVNDVTKQFRARDYDR